MSNEVEASTSMANTTVQFAAVGDPEAPGSSTGGSEGASGAGDGGGSDKGVKFSNEDANPPKRPELMTAKSTRPIVPRGYSVSRRLVEDGTTKMHLKRLWQKLTVGGSTFDGFLLAASQEVGQSILSLPYVFAQLGFAGGIIFEFFFATLALYTCVLLVCMHAQYRHNLKVNEDPKHYDEYYIVSYHEIMEHFVGKWLKYFSMAVVFFALIGLSTVQIIATASNMYLVSDHLSKRTWAIVAGCVFTPIAFVPTFRHYRLLSVLGIGTTTYVAWFMTVTSIISPPQENVVHNAPQNFESFILGAVALLFTYGGHTSNIEVADVMDNPAAYDRSYFWSYVYVFTLTMPNAVAAYYRFGDLCLYNTNSFALFPKSVGRDLAMIFMSLHEMVAFGLFAGPLFHMWEKLIHIHHKPFAFRAAMRIPLCALMVFLAVAFPFFGAINAMLGAFTTSFGTYIIPAFAFNMAFKSDEGMIKQPYFNFKVMRIINWITVALVMILGVGYGGYASIKNFINQFSEYEVFAECYQCNKYGKLQTPDKFDELSEEGRFL